MIAATGSCNGIENYSRFLTGRLPGEPPPTLFEYLPENAVLFVDESHVTIGQINGMSRGDHRRKITLAEYGFRLPSAIDNRPLRFNEWDAMRPQTVSVSATPGNWEMEQTGGVFVEQVIRPTGLIDPPVEIKPVEEQVQDLIIEARKTTELGYRTLVTTLTKRMAEDLTEYMHEAGIKVRYMHSDVETLERIELIRDLRLGVYDVLIGINLLREGLDIPECGLVAILTRIRRAFCARDLAHSDDRACGSQRRWSRDPLCRPDHRIDGARHAGNVAASREADGVQHRTRHHPADDPPPDRRHHRACGERRSGDGADRRGPSAHGRPQSARLYRGTREKMRKAAADLDLRKRAGCAMKSASWRMRSWACWCMSRRHRSWVGPTRASRGHARRGSGRARSLRVGGRRIKGFGLFGLCSPSLPPAGGVRDLVSVKALRLRISYRFHGHAPSASGRDGEERPKGYRGKPHPKSRFSVPTP